MKVRHFGWVLGCVVGLAGAARALSNMTLAECYQAAQKQSEILAGQTELVNQAEARYRQALAAVLPGLSLQGIYLHQQEKSGPASDQTVAKLAAVQPLFRGFREYAALRQTQNLITAEKEARQWANLQLYQDVAEAFYTVLSLETEQAHLEIQLRLYDQRIKDLQDRVRIGRSRDSEVLSVQSAQAGLQAQVQELQGLIDVAKELLTFLTGLPRDSQCQAPAPFAQTLEPVETYLDRAQNRPDIAAARSRVEAGRDAVGVATGGHWPSLDASANYYLYESGVSQENTWDAQLALTLPLFLGGAVAATTAEAQAQLRQNELTWERLRRSAEQEIRGQYATVQTGLAQRQAWEKASALAHQNYLAVVRDYNLGLATNLDVLKALADDQDALRSLDRARFGVWIGYSRLLASSALVPAAEVAGNQQP
ncbi:MAG: TolC family protein [candidate division FCPU426 bacterium]